MALLPEIERGPTWCETFKRQCLCREVRRMPENERNAFMALVQKIHGRPFAVALYREAMALEEPPC